MIHLEIQTIYLMFSMASLVYTIGLFASWMGDRQERSLLFFSLAPLLSGLGGLFIGLQSLMPLWLALGIGNVMIVCAYQSMIMALAFHARTPLPWKSALLLDLAYLLFYLFCYTPEWLYTRIVVSGVLLFLLHLLIARHFLSIDEPGARITARAGSLTALAGGLTALWRISFADHQGTTTVLQMGQAFTWGLVASFFLDCMLLFLVLQLYHARLRGKLSQLASFDDLTGLHNRRYFQDSLNQRRLETTPDSHAILMIDIDRFKRINDEHGHLAGDAVLRHFAHSLRSQLRQQDLAARFGGEEFVVFLQATSRDEAHAIAERIRKKIEHSPADLQGSPLFYTVSIGLSLFQPMLGQSARESVEQADKALYLAKRSGRNCTQLHGDEFTLQAAT